MAAMSASTCRANGWGVGTRLVGDEGYGPHRDRDNVDR